MIYGYFPPNIYEKIHGEVAAVLKLSRSRLAKPDKSASVRVSAQKVLPKPIPSPPCFPAFVFPLLIGSWSWGGRWIDGGKKGGGVAT